MITKIHNGDVLTCLTYGQTEYWHVGEVRPTPPYFLNGNQVNCTASVYDVTGEDEVNAQSPVITDSANKLYAPGPRPRNIVRRK